LKNWMLLDLMIFNLWRQTAKSQRALITGDWLILTVFDGS